MKSLKKLRKVRKYSSRKKSLKTLTEEEKCDD